MRRVIPRQAGKGGEWSDADMLEVLALTDSGVSAAAIAVRFGRTRAAICGLLKRIRDDLEVSERVRPGGGAAGGQP